MDSFLKYSGVVALVIIAIMFFGGAGSKMLGSTSCGSITCLSGGLRLVSDAGGDFESDVAAVFASTVNITGDTTISGSVSTGLLTFGGGVTATSSTGAVTLTATNLFGGNVLQHTNSGATTLTLPASSTVTAFIPTAGQCRFIFYKNLGTALDTLAGGTGTSLRIASSTVGTGLKTVSAGGVAQLEACRLSTTDIEVFMSPAI